MNPPEIFDFLGQAISYFLERIAAQELDNLRDLGKGRLDLVPLPKIYRCIVNMKPEGKLAFSELQIEPLGLNMIAPRP